MCREWAFGEILRHGGSGAEAARGGRDDDPGGPGRT